MFVVTHILVNIILFIVFYDFFHNAIPIFEYSSEFEFAIAVWRGVLHNYTIIL